jgi:hypothetical protein
MTPAAICAQFKVCFKRRRPAEEKRVSDCEDGVRYGAYSAGERKFSGNRQVSLKP